MKVLLLLLPLLFQYGSPTPMPDLSSIFNDPSVPLENLDYIFLNLTGDGARGISKESIHEKRAITLQAALYEATFRGPSHGGLFTFSLVGRILITSEVLTPGITNGRNILDIVIAVNSPSAFENGRLKYTTNRYLNPTLGFSSATRFDFATVAYTGTLLTAQADPEVAAQNLASEFILSSSLFYPPFRPTSGGFTFDLRNDAISGNVNLNGKAIPGGNTVDVYKASVSGRKIARGPITI